MSRALVLNLPTEAILHDMRERYMAWVTPDVTFALTKVVAKPKVARSLNGNLHSVIT